MFIFLGLRLANMSKSSLITQALPSSVAVLTVRVILEKTPHIKIEMFHNGIKVITWNNFVLIGPAFSLVTCSLCTAYMHL